jgi:hypothetical protein
VRRPSFTFAAWLSLLLAAATTVLWARSYRHVSGAGGADSLDFTHADPYWWLVSNRGQLTLCHQVGHDWNSPVPKLRILGLEYAGSWVGSSSLVNLFVPYWMLILPLLVLPGARLRFAARDRTRRRRQILGLCARCGYDLRGSHARCPECGTPIPSGIRSSLPGR